MDKWHVWTIVQQRYKRIAEFLESLDEVSSFFYPTVLKEYNTKSGKAVKSVPLFNNYIFIKYPHDIYIEDRIASNPWIKKHLGECSQKEMDNILILSKKKYEDLIPTNKVIEGHSYKLLGTPFKGMTCTVVEIDGDTLTVAVTLFGSDRLIKCSIENIELEG